MQNTLEKEKLSAEENAETTEEVKMQSADNISAVDNAEDDANLVEPETAVCASVAVSGISGTDKGCDDMAEIRYKSHAKRGFRYGCYLFIKRTFDIVSSGLFLLVFSWLYLILAIVVKCSDGGSVFYRHKRVGKNGKTIYIPKFRSMKKNADKLEDMLTPEQLEQYKREYKIDNDPRITKVGGFLRKTSLDELPNIWAIFKGDISVIGPRPLMQSEVEDKYGEDAAKLLSVKPGMIGWWAANGRSNTTYESGERQKLELYYVDHCSLWLDIKIIFKTIWKVIKRDGAK